MISGSHVIRLILFGLLKQSTSAFFGRPYEARFVSEALFQILLDLDVIVPNTKMHCLFKLQKKKKKKKK